MPLQASTVNLFPLDIYHVFSDCLSCIIVTRNSNCCCSNAHRNTQFLSFLVLVKNSLVAAIKSACIGQKLGGGGNPFHVSDSATISFKEF